MNKPTTTLMVLLALSLALTGCKTTAPASTSTKAPDPASSRLGQVNNELDQLLAERAELYQVRQISEVQRFESMGAQARITGLGPKALTGQFGEDQYIDVGAFRQMHDQAVTEANKSIRAIDAKIEKLDARMETLKAERAKIESRADKYSTRSSFPGPGGCFTPDTEVPVPGGSKAIASITVGDEVMVMSDDAGKTEFRRVLSAHRFSEDHYFLLNGDVRATALHRFMTEAGWMCVKDLQIGMRLKTAGGWTVLESKRLLDAPVAVFNLEVAGENVFFVAGAREKYLVHNGGGGGK